MRIPNLDVYEGMPNHTRLRSRDVLLVFGYKGRGATQYVIKKLIPPHTIAKPIWGKHRNPIFFWVLGDLRKLKLQLEKEQLCEP